MHGCFAATIEIEDNSSRWPGVDDVVEYDKGVGPAAAIPWRDLRSQDLREGDYSPNGYPHFRATDLGRAVARWLAELNVQWGYA